MAHDELESAARRGQNRFLGGGNGGFTTAQRTSRTFGNKPNFYRLRIGTPSGDKNKVVGFVLGASRPPASRR